MSMNKQDILLIYALITVIIFFTALAFYGKSTKMKCSHDITNTSLEKYRGHVSKKISLSLYHS